jgi:membrane protein DedA with SNARE-associated domain
LAQLPRFPRFITPRLGQMYEFLQTHGYWAIMLVLVLTGSGLPIPEEVPIITAGVLAAEGVLQYPWLALGCCLFGAIVGDAIMYWIGYHFGRGVLREHRWWARFVTPKRECQVEQMFKRHGLKVFFVARFLVGLRSPVYLTAGILRVSFRRFVVIDLICATAVVGTFFGLSYLFGEHIAKFIRRAQLGITIAVVLVVAAIAFYLWRRYRRKHGPANLPCAGETDPPPRKPDSSTANKIKANP